MAMDSEMPQPDSQTGAGHAAPTRSERSREFETFWRGLPKDGLIPHRRDVKPARAAALLRDMVMLEVRLNEEPSMRIRLVGSSIQERIQNDITGRDYLDFRPAEYRADTLDAARRMLSQPCGLWQVMAMHYERGFAQNFELTAFPLLGDDADVPLIFGLMNPAGGLVRARSSSGNPIVTDTATIFEFIDIGADKPVRPL
jgi:hypothetical protein